MKLTAVTPEEIEVSQRVVELSTGKRKAPAWFKTPHEIATSNLQAARDLGIAVSEPG